MSDFPSTQPLEAVLPPQTLRQGVPILSKCDSCLFSGLQSLKKQALSKDGALLKHSKIMREIKCFSSPKLACLTGAVMITPNSCTGLKACGKCGVILWLELLVCLQGHLTYFFFVSSASPPPRLEPGLELQTFFYVSLSLPVFLYSLAVLSLFSSPNALPLLSSEYSLTGGMAYVSSGKTFVRPHLE